jgi:hypothetical protein
VDTFGEQQGSADVQVDHAITSGDIRHSTRSSH